MISLCITADKRLNIVYSILGEMFGPVIDSRSWIAGVDDVLQVGDPRVNAAGSDICRCRLHHRCDAHRVLSAFEREAAVSTSNSMNEIIMLECIGAEIITPMWLWYNGSSVSLCEAKECT